LSKAQHLAGKRILITRARHQAARLAEALEAHGAEVLRLPTIEIVPPETYAHLDAALEVASGFDWLIVTSANGAAALADRMQFLGIPLERLKHLQVAAIGPATAAAITRIGLKVAAMPEEYVAEAVVAMLRERVAGKRVLLARAAVARDCGGAERRSTWPKPTGRSFPPIRSSRWANCWARESCCPTPLPLPVHQR
jgi:uroporphyrinogen-III synthase